MMDLVKQYMVQAVISAANNLRLSTEKIEVVALIRETIGNSSDLEKEIHEMKKITEFSTFAIKLGEVFNYIARSKVDFIKVSDKFKEHTHLLVKDLNNVLDRVTPQSYRQLLNKVYETTINVDLTKESTEKSVPAAESETKKDEQPIIYEQKTAEESAPVEGLSVVEPARPEDTHAENERLKEEIILEDEEKDDIFLFENYEEKILKPIKELDALLKTMTPDKVNYDDIKKYLVIMRKNAELSSRSGFDIIADMHKIFAHALHLIETRNVLPVKEVIEGMRSCLIVIVAVIRGKEVDISNYLNRAEYFGRQIQNIK